MLFNFEDANLKTLEEKVRSEERLSFDDGVTLWNSFDLLGVGYLANIVREKILIMAISNCISFGSKNSALVLGKFPR